MSIAADLKKAWRNTAAALLPQDCFLCAAASGDNLLCPACSAGLPYLSAERCPLCALPTPGAAVCGACLKQAPHFDATQAVFRYEFPLDRLIQSLKYAHRLASANFLGRALAQLAAPLRPDLVLPVPLAPARLAERGFNQALELARPLARALGVPLELSRIHRRRDTAPQASLPWKERKRNIRRAFECEIDLTGKTVLVVDDVMTTGATLDELARTLKAHGATRVENSVLARALKD
ncbi:ComF family protein [Sulfuritalea sp.]|uniref:ComF family protein n=1 Tax=Sulfuritalea sp. TaxID=2480090 RepID=UPI00286E4BDD|nr:ComF family protein [Sulfuritalea sp.]